MTLRSAYGKEILQRIISHYSHKNGYERKNKKPDPNSDSGFPKILQEVAHDAAHDATYLHHFLRTEPI